MTDPKASSAAQGNSGGGASGLRGQEGHDGSSSGATGASFTCFQCGAQVPFDTDRCPQCRSFYVKDVRDEEIDELLRAESTGESALGDFVDAHGSSMVHFDTEIGLMHLLEDDRTDPGFVSECSRCGTVVELDTDRCPMCGATLTLEDHGLVRIFKDMDIAPGPVEEADCPYCGEHVTLESGHCPVCDKILDVRDGGRDPLLKVCPVLLADNVVFMHLDIGTGEIDILQRGLGRPRYHQMSLLLDWAGNGDQGADRKAPSRG